MNNLPSFAPMISLYSLIWSYCGSHSAGEFVLV